MRSTASTFTLAAVLALAAGCGGDNESRDEAGAAGKREPALPQGAQPVELDPADFVSTIDNPYWPMTPGTKWVYRERDGESEQRVEVTVTDLRRKVTGIDATVVHDLVTENGEVIEDTYDWYGQDRWGNVWYLGEETKEYEDGKVVSTAGSWQAGVDGAQAGIVIPADPKVGMKYRQEYYEGEAEDAGEILSLDEQAEVAYGSFDHVLMTKDTTPLEPDILEHKFYARGVGPILAIALSGGGGREELVSFTKGG